MSPDGRVIETPPHRHKVALDFAQFELGLAIVFDEAWELRLRIPYSIKRQKAEVRFSAPTDQLGRAAILRNQQVHHRSETYQGIGDPMVLLASTLRSIFRPDDGLIVATGVSLPFGQTERDPFEAGDEGREHLHIQFGTGTFDPLLEVQYETTLSEPIRFQLFASGRFPFYENSKSFRPPIEVSASSSLILDLAEAVSLYGGYLLFLQGYGEWRATGRDENTGLVSHSLLGGLALRFGEIAINFEFRFPLSQRTFNNEGDAFEQRPSFLIAASHTF